MALLNIESFVRDLKHSLRMFGQSPGFTATAIAAIALGIGTNTAIFSVVNAVLLRPLHAPDPERIVVFIGTNREGSSTDASEIKFNLWREQTAILQDVSAYYQGSVNLTGVDQPQRANAFYVTGNYFRLFGLSIARGRSFAAEEERPGGPKVVILSDSFWKKAFGGDAGAIGKSISLGSDVYQVIGLMAAGVQTETPQPIDVWLPFDIDPNSNFQGHYFKAAARLKPGVTVDMANARLRLTTEEFRRRFPNSISTSRGDIFSVEPMRDVLVKDVRLTLLILVSAVGLVLLIACANVANLLLVRAAGRTREIAVRLALGASRMTIVRQLLTESVLLSLVGSVFGLFLGITAIHALLAVSAANLPRIGVKGENVTIDWRVLAFTILVALFTAFAFGIIPALKASGTELNSSLKENGGRTGTGFRQNKARALLVVSEMSLALLLLIGAALLIRTLIVLRSVDPGFDSHNVLTTRTSIEPRSTNKATADEIMRDAFRRLSTLPGVTGVGYTRLLPLEGEFNSVPIVVVGRPLNGVSHGSVRWMVVSSSYFDVLSIPLRRGHVFTDGDRLGTPLVAIINQTMARQLWQNGDPLGDQVLIGKGLGRNMEEPPRQVVGIVGDVHDNGLEAQSQPTVFVPGAQLPNQRVAGRPVAWVLRTHAPSLSLNSAIVSELGRATGEPVPPVRTMDEVIRQSTARQDFNMLLMSTFAVSALLLAAIGIYGLMAYTVQQRTQEIGLRMALGARSGNVQGMLLLQSMRLVFVGIAVGIIAAIGLTRFLSSFLFGVRPLDPLTFVLMPVLLGAVAFAAVWFPVRHASRLDPITALRYE